MEVGDARYYVYAPAAGLFEPYFRLGDEVRAGQAAGVVHFIDDPLREPVPAQFALDGTVVCRRPKGRVERGDCVAHLATDLQL